jgi:hypothetical protein
MDRTGTPHPGVRGQVWLFLGLSPSVDCRNPGGLQDDNSENQKSDPEGPMRSDESATEGHEDRGYGNEEADLKKSSVLRGHRRH